MRRSNKHQAAVSSFVGMTGGVNVAQAPEQIPQTDMQVCENFIYEIDSNRLTGRGGLALKHGPMANDIKELFYDVGTNTVFAFLANRDVYLIDFVSSPKYIGSVMGDKIPVCAKFQNKLWIASGSKIQFYDYSSNIQTVVDSPTCDICFQRNARIFCTLTGDDNAYYSGIGDGTSWTENTNDSSKEQWAEVGYGDDGDICAVVPLATDMIFFKTNGNVYQFTGDATPETWVITPLATKTDVKGKMCATNIGNGVVFLSERGLRSLNAVMDYGNIASSDIGDKFNKLVTKNLVDTARFFHLTRHKTILIRPTSDHRYFIAFNYGLNSATVLNFAVPVESICETSDKIILSSGANIYQITDEATTDAGEPINYHIKTKEIIGSEEMLVKSVDSKFTSDHAGTATISTSSLRVNMPTNARRKVKCNHSTECISLDVQSNDRFILDHINLEVAQL